MSDEMSNYERLRAGLPYTAPDQEIFEMQALATQAYLEVNASEGKANPDERRELLRKHLGAFGESFMLPPIRWEFGKHIFVGDTTLINADCLFMDSAEIRIGSYTLIAPGCKFLAAGHPVAASDRMKFDPETGEFDHCVCIAKPIHIGNHCWIGGGATIVGGVSIGDGSMIGAGSVVTKDVPPAVLAAGNPAQIIRALPPPE